MRFTAFLVATTFALASGSVMACPMQTTAKTQTVASSGGNSTPIPAKAQRATEG